MVLVALAAFSINTFSSVGNGGGLGTTTIRARKKTHRLPNLLDQQIAILVGLDINPNWVREQSTTNSLIYDTVKPDDAIPTGINKGYSYLVTGNRDKGISPFFKADKRKVMIKHANHDEKPYIKTVPLFRLVE